MQSNAKRILVILLMAFAFLQAPSVAAQASETTFNQEASETALNQVDCECAYLGRTQYLTADPQPWMPTAKVERRIYLASDWYQWYTYRVGKLTGSREIWLGSGWYTWTVYLFPKDGYYRQISYLNPDHPGWDTAMLRSVSFELPYSGEWGWGSQLHR